MYVSFVCDTNWKEDRRGRWGAQLASLAVAAVAQAAARAVEWAAAEEETTFWNHRHCTPCIPVQQLHPL